jgi:hypothetical protein
MNSVAKHDNGLIISAYATRTSGCDTILGKIKGSFENADCKGEGDTMFLFFSAFPDELIILI